MRDSIVPACAVLTILLAACPTAVAAERTVELFPDLEVYLTAREAEFDRIPRKRKQELHHLTKYVSERVAAGERAKLLFVCTHNSRRSHMAQLWAATAAAFYGVPGVTTFSGGTEATAFNPRAVAAVERAGFQVTRVSEERNAVYEVRVAADADPFPCFSKVFDQSPNPDSGFAAVMTCAQADKHCPNVRGANARISIPYEDPKVADDTPSETATYDERCAQIAREMMYVFARVQSSVSRH